MSQPFKLYRLQQTDSQIDQLKNRLNQIAVLNLEAVGVSESESITLSDRLRSEIVSVGSFTVIERAKMNTILKEQGFQNSGCTTDECAVEIGKLLNIHVVTAGSIGQVGSMYTISLRMIDVESGEILLTVNEETSSLRVSFMMIRRGDSVPVSYCFRISLI